MNQEQTNYVLQSFLDYSVCGNTECPLWLSAFNTNAVTRCPVCNEPAMLPHGLPISLHNKKASNIYERYFPDFLVQAFSHDNMLRAADTIGNTPLTTNQHIGKWAGLDTLYLKEEYANPSGSFKDRGTLTAIALQKVKLSRESPSFTNSFVLGTVSTGNMAISTAYWINQINNLTSTHLKSYIVVNSHTKMQKIEAIDRASGATGSVIFTVEGDYSAFHDIVYTAARKLRRSGHPVYAFLTDDIFRIAGYGTLFGEIIEQMASSPDFIILPVASGALFRVAVWALESLFRGGYIQKIPRVILVQEKGADPITQAFRKKLHNVAPVKLHKNLLADGIDVSYSRSGNPALRILEQNYHLCISVTPLEIREALDALHSEHFFAEEASAAALAGAKKLRKEKILSKSTRTVCVLTGGAIAKRQLGNITGASIKIPCVTAEFEQLLRRQFGSKNQDALEKNVLNGGKT